MALRQWGINVNLAPVADVGRTGSFLMAQERSFGTNPVTVGADVVAFVAGLQDGGVAATLKHFPGLGAAVTNTDLFTGFKVAVKTLTEAVTSADTLIRSLRLRHGSAP